MIGLRRSLITAACAIVAVGLLTACSSSKSHSAGAAVASGCASGGLNDHTDQTYCGLGLSPAQPRPNFTLTSTTGASYQFGKETSGKPTLLFFGYTTCPDVCPETMADIANALRQGPAKIRQATQVVFVSTDPSTDTARVIKAWLHTLAPDLPFIGLRGTLAQVQAAEAISHVTTSSEDGKTHSAEVLLYGADDYARVAFLQSNDETADITHDLGKIVS